MGFRGRGSRCVRGAGRPGGDSGMTDPGASAGGDGAVALAEDATAPTSSCRPEWGRKHRAGWPWPTRRSGSAASTGQRKVSAPPSVRWRCSTKSSVLTWVHGLDPARPACLASVCHAEATTVHQRGAPVLRPDGSRGRQGRTHRRTRRSATDGSPDRVDLPVIPIVDLGGGWSRSSTPAVERGCL